MKKIISALALAITLPCFANNGADSVIAGERNAPSAQVETVTGTVDDLVVENHVTGVTTHHKFLRKADGSTIGLQGVAADRLTKGARVRAHGHHVDDSITTDDVSVISGASKKNSEPKAETVVEGTLVLIHQDAPKDKSVFKLAVQQDDGRGRELKLGVKPDSLRAGMRVRAHGDAINTLELDTNLIEVTAQPQVLPMVAPGSPNVLFVPIQFANVSSVPWSIAAIQDVMNTGARSTKNFFTEGSFGKVTPNITVPPAYVKVSLSPTSCNDYWNIGAAAKSAYAAAYPNDKTVYQYYVYYWPALSCGWLGMGMVGGPSAWINGNLNITTIGHEMGHTFGLLHAGSTQCTAPNVVGPTCYLREYGDDWNMMGNIDRSGVNHFDATQKALLGWIPASSVQTYNGTATTYTLTPIEMPGGTTYAVKVPTKSTRTYWIEYRQPIGFDVGLAAYPNNGAQIRVSAPFEKAIGSDDTQLLDMTPATLTFADSALVSGQSYTDTENNVTIAVGAATPTSLQVSVSGTYVPPPKTQSTVALTSSKNPATVGDKVIFAANISGNAPIGSVNFTDGSSSLSGCSAVAVPVGTANSKTVQCASSTLAVGTHPVAAWYGGDVNNIPSNGTLSEVIAAAPLPPPPPPVPVGINVALASNGGVVSANSTPAGTGYLPAYVNDGRRTGAVSGVNGYWHDLADGFAGDWIQINFSGSKTITSAVVYTLQDNWQSPVEPTDTTTFVQWGITGWNLQGWNGSAWVLLASVANNHLVKKTVTFPAFTTDRVRLNITNGAYTRSYVVEVEVWGQ